MKQRRSDRRGAKHRREPDFHAEGLRALERLQNERALFEPAATRVVHAALERARLDGSGAPVIEIGSGGGQLRRWLPDALLPVMMHTEREPAFVRKFRQAVPQARVLVASAESLPFPDGTVAGVLGLCVLDVVGLAAVATELHRVLAPGGCAVQFWDMAPNMQWLCEREMGQGCVLLPDCFSDPLVRAELPAELQTALPPMDFMQDLISVPSAQLQNLIALLRPSPTNLIAGTSLERLARHVEIFAGLHQLIDDGSSTASAAAARALALLCEDEREASACKRLLLNAWLMLKQARGGDKLPLELRRISSARALCERLTEVFAATGLEITCDLQRARALVPRPPVQKGTAGERLRRSRFVGRWVGTTAFAAEVPLAYPEVLAADEAPAPDQLVVEAGLLVFVARRTEAVRR